MFTLLSLVVSIKDYIEVVHKLVETSTPNAFEVTSYYDLGAILTYLVLSGKELFSAFFTFKWLQSIGSLPLIVPDVASAMISEISVLDGYLHNAFTFLETPISYGNQNELFYGIEKFSVGLINSIFLCLPTSTAHIVTLRRFVMQGIEAGYLAGLGTLAGNMLWIGSILFGLRFIVIPWLSLDILRYGLGFLLLVKYMWDSYSEKRTVLEDLSKWKIFLLNFLLAFTEQATIYPFLSNLSLGSDATILESFPTGSFLEYSLIHICYLGGLLVGSLSLLQLTCWFWEKPAFNIYMWAMSSLKMTNTISQKFVNVCFLYLTMFFAISNVSYFGLDYTLTSPLGLVHEDRLIDQKVILETTFLNTKASDRNTRRNRGRHGRRERWKRRVRRYRTFDASLYDQGVYDLFTIEDLNYGFDRFWLRRKIRNHRVRFRFFPGPWMRSFKKQLARPRLESFMGPRVEFFRILFEQAYHPEFHEFRNSKTLDKNQKLEKNSEIQNPALLLNTIKKNNLISFYAVRNQKIQTQNLLKEYSALRKFIRKVKTRTNTAQILSDVQSNNIFSSSPSVLLTKASTKRIYSKRWKQIFSKISHNIDNTSLSKGPQQKLLNTFYNKTILKPTEMKSSVVNYFENIPLFLNTKNTNLARKKSEKLLSKKDRQILRYKTFLNKQQTLLTKPNEKTKTSLSNEKTNIYKPLTLLHPIAFYLQKEQGFQRKMKFYGATVFRNFSIENNAPYYRVMMKKFFYYYKPTLRWERTMRTATMRKARRKAPRVPRKLNVTKKTQMLAITAENGDTFQKLNNSQAINTSLTRTISPEFNENIQQTLKTEIQKPTHFYSLVSKRATRYRYQIYKDVLQHWYYTPFNRLLLKFDVDSFIRRQPSAQFLTKNEENLLHLKRFLLADYYNTLRWYSYMQHYDAMKTTIGKTKSFTSRSYNQQFFGTFKKIRHLFGITPSLTENNVLKFDQPLFTEYSNKEEELNKNFSFYNSSVIHEELLADEDLYPNTTLTRKKLPEDLTNQSSKILKNYLQNAIPIRQDYIQQLLEEKNYSELTNFLFKGQKTRGTKPITNENSLLNQEKNYFLSINEKKIEKEKIQNFLRQKVFSSSIANSNLPTLNSFSSDPSSLWISLMKKSRNMLYNQEALKNYVSGRVEKFEKQKKRQEKFFKTRLTNMKNWVNLKNQTSSKNESSANLNVSGLKTSLQKAIKEGIYYQTSGASSGLKLETSNLRNNRPKILSNLPILGDLAKQNNKKTELSGNSKFTNAKNIAVNLKNHLKIRVKQRAIKTMEAESRLRKSFSSVQNILKKSDSNFSLKNLNPSLVNKLINQTLTPFKFVSYSIYQNMNSILSSEKPTVFFSPLKSILQVFVKNKQKNLNSWKQKEMVLSTRKKIRRKIYRVLDQKKQIEKMSNLKELENLSKIQNLNPLRQKQDILETLETQRRQKAWNSYESRQIKNLNDNPVGHTKIKQSSHVFSKIFEKNFKRKRTRSRRYRRFKGRGPIKKHTLAEKLKRQFKLLKRYGEKQEGQDKKMEIFQMITKRKYNANSSFETRTTKQRRTRQSKHRYWKKHKRQQYLQLKRKQRKRRRYAISKLRVLNKEFKRIKGNFEIKKWWWHSFLPNFTSTTDTYWQLEKNQQIKQELADLSLSEILDRDSSMKTKTTDILQIGNQDYKPLAMPEALRLRKALMDQNQLTFEAEVQKNKVLNSNKVENFSEYNLTKALNVPKFTSTNKSKTNKNILSKLSENLLKTQSASLNNLSINTDLDFKKMVNVTSMPFYAGWDETLRQFVVTNRLLSRTEAGYSMNFSTTVNSKTFVPANLNSLHSSTQNSTLEFTKAPLQGMNAATTLYWQIPFTTYDPDQFFALGMDGFSPLAWRFFNFKHSKQTTKPMLVKNILYTNEKTIKNQSLLSYNIQLKMLHASSKNSSDSWKNSWNFSSTKGTKNQARKIQKRQKRVKKHPRPPVWFPSGPLTNQVLPVHYIYVFYKRTRLPRDRYIGRRLRRSDDLKSNFIQANFPKILDFTLRKRVKPIRKYHRKRILNKNQENGLIVRRRPFKGFESENPRFRPIAKTRLTTQTDILNASLLKTKQRKKSLTNKQNPENLRIRQLRRRIQRQVLRPIWRYKPRSGGFVWPGDYLRLESIKAPILKFNPDISTPKISGQTPNLQVRKKKRKTIQEWQIQPKTYLLQKHNLKVLKKRLEKSQNFNNFSQKVKELNLTI